MESHKADSEFTLMCLEEGLYFSRFL